MFALLILLLAIISWLGSIYISPDIHSLLTSDGLRWIVSNMLPALRQAPLGEILLCLVALGTLSESGLPDLCLRLLRRSTRRDVSLKSRRALQWSLLLGILIVVALLSLVLLPPAPLLSAYGTFAHSPLQQGLYPIAMISLMLVAYTFGLLSGRFLSLADITHAAAYLPTRYASALLPFLLATQLVAQLDYVFPHFAAAQPLLHAIIRWVLLLLPLIRAAAAARHRSSTTA